MERISHLNSQILVCQSDCRHLYDDRVFSIKRTYCNLHRSIVMVVDRELITGSSTTNRDNTVDSVYHSQTFEGKNKNVELVSNVREVLYYECLAIWTQRKRKTLTEQEKNKTYKRRKIRTIGLTTRSNNKNNNIKINLHIHYVVD